MTSSSTRSIRPLGASRLDIRCIAADAMVANLAVHVVFFFQRRLDTEVLARAFGRALVSFPVFAARMAPNCGRMRIRCRGQGVPFTVASSERSLEYAIASTSRDSGGWLIDPVNGATARWGLGPLCAVRITHLAGDATAIGFSWHHAIGDMQTAMHFLETWAAATGGVPVPEPVIIEDRVEYLHQRLPADGARQPGVRCLSSAETVRSVRYLVCRARKQRTLTLSFDHEEITRMRAAYEGHDASRIRLSANDAVCAHVAEALMRADPAVETRSLAIAVNARSRCGLNPGLVGNIITTLNIEVRRGESARSIAARLREAVDHFADRHNDLRANQTFFDDCGIGKAGRCVSVAFNPARWNILISNWSGFGVYRIRLDGTAPCYFTPLLQVPVAGLAALVDRPERCGLTFQISLPPEDFGALSARSTFEYLHRFAPVQART